MSINAAELIVAVKAVGALDAMGALAAVGAAVVAAGVESVKMAGDFEASMVRLVTSAGESQKNLKMVSDGVLAMATEVGTSTTQLANGLYMVESAGFHGAAGLEVLRLSAEGAKAENADLATVTNAVTSALNAYHYSADKAAFVTNTMVAAVAAGKMHMQDLASAVANILPVSAKFGISLTDVTAALATMTSMGDNASAAATHLRQMILALEAPAKAGSKALASIGLTTQEVTDEMRISLPGAIQMIADALGKKFPEGTYAYDQAIKNIAGGSKQLMGMIELSGKSLDTFKGDVTQITKAVKEGGNSIMGWSDIQATFNFKLDQAGAALQVLGIKLGTAFLPMLDQALGAVTPLIQSFGEWIDKSQILQDVAQTLSGWIGYIGDAFNQANKAVAPFKETLATFTQSYGQVLNQFEQTSTAIAPLHDAFAGTLNSLQQLGQTTQPLTAGYQGFLDQLHRSSTVVAPLTDSFDRANAVLGHVHATVKSQANVWVPFWQEILHVKQQIMDINWGAVWQGIQKIATAISDMDWGKVGAFFSNIATNISKMDWGKFAKSFEGFVLSLTKVDWGKVGDNATKIFGAMTGVDWGKIAADLPKVIDGLSKVDWGAIGNAFQDVIKTVQFVAGIFTWLYDFLLGHSIIPDLINGMVRWFSQLPGRLGSIVSNTVNTIVQWLQSLWSRGMGAVNGFIADIGGAFAGLLGRAYGWGSGLIDNVISGIRNASGGIGNALHGLHIPGFASGVENFGGGLAYVHAGEVLTYLPRGTSVTPANQVSAMMHSGSSSGGASSNRPVNLSIYFDTHEMARILAPAIADEMRARVGLRM